MIHRPTVLTLFQAVAFGGANEFEEMYQLWEEEKATPLGDAALLAICRSQDPVRLKRVIDLLEGKRCVRGDYILLPSG